MRETFIGRGRNLGRGRRLTRPWLSYYESIITGKVRVLCCTKFWNGSERNWFTLQVEVDHFPIRSLDWRNSLDEISVGSDFST